MTTITLPAGEMLASKKFLALAGGVLVAVSDRLGIDLDPQTRQEVVALVVAYLVGQGIADIGKHRVPDGVRQDAPQDAAYGGPGGDPVRTRPPISSAASGSQRRSLAQAVRDRQ